MKILDRFAIAVSLIAGLGAQDVQRSGTKPASSDTKWKALAEIGIQSEENKVVAKGFEYAKSFIAAGVRDGEGENWMGRMFLTSESMAAAPLRFRLLRDASRGTPMRHSPYVLFDHAKKIDFGEMFAAMNPGSIDVEGGYLVRGMFLAPVSRPGGGYRMNFGDKHLFGDKPTENELLTKYHDIEVRAPNERLMQRLRQLPIYVQMDTRPLMDGPVAREISAFFGPKGGLLSASITSMGNRPVVDVYSGIGPGDGLVGQYLDRQPRLGVVLGSLNFELGFILAADLGKVVPRSLLTLLNAAPDTEQAAVDAISGLLESWDGRITIVGAGTEPPAQLGADVDFEEQFERLTKSLHGAVLFGLEDDSAAEIVKDLEKFLSGPAAKKTGLAIQLVEDGRRRAFQIAGEKFVSLGAGKHLVAIGVANTLVGSCDLRDGCLEGKSTVRAPKKFTMVNGPVRLWAHKGLLRYVGVWFRGVDGLFGRSLSNRIAWIRKTLEDDVLGHDLALSLTWNRRIGTMLRVLF